MKGLFDLTSPEDLFQKLLHVHTSPLATFGPQHVRHVLTTQNKEATCSPNFG